MWLCAATRSNGFVDENKFAENWTKTYTMRTTLQISHLNKNMKMFNLKIFNEISLENW